MASISNKFKDAFYKFISGKSLGKSKQLVPHRMQSYAEPILGDIEGAIDGMRTYAEKRPMVHGGIGALTGAGIGAATGKELTPAEKKKNRETMKWWKGLSPAQRMSQKNQNKFKKDYIRSRSERAASGALLGGVGTYLTSSALLPFVAHTESKKLVDLVNSSVYKSTDGKMNMSPIARKDFFTRAKDTILNDPTEIMSRPTMPMLSRRPVDKARAYESLMKDLEFESKSSFGLKMPDLVGETTALQEHYLDKFVKGWNRGSVSGIETVLTRLRGEGINTAKEFAKKYHPDRNKNVPKDIKENFGKILEALKGGAAGVSEIDMIAQGMKGESSARISKANAMINKYKGKKF